MRLLEIFGAGPKNRILQAITKRQNELNEQLFKWVMGVNSEKGKIEVERLINSGADVNARDEHMQTPLIVAAAYEAYPGTLRLLLERGANVNAKDANGETALFRALRMLGDQAHKDAFVRILLTNKADVNIRNNVGQTPLFFAIDNSFEFSDIKILLEHGANVNEVGDEYFKDTPLMQAVRRGKKALVELLLNTEGINVNARNTKNGKTALDYATITGKDEIISLLKKAGAKE